jgi:hypothetical protein
VLKLSRTVPSCLAIVLWRHNLIYIQMNGLNIFSFLVVATGSNVKLGVCRYVLRVSDRNVRALITAKVHQTVF